MKFGALSSDDLLLALSLTDTLERQLAEAQLLLMDEKDRLFSSDCLKPAWSHLYELPILQHALLFFEPKVGSDFLNELASSPNQIQFAKGALSDITAEIDAWELTTEEKENLRKRSAAYFAFAYSLFLSLRSLRVFGVYLNRLVEIVRDDGPNAEKALLAAVKIDRTVLACPTINAFVSKRVLLQDKKFLKSLRAAEHGKLNAREQRNYQQMRLVLQILHEVGAKKLSPKDLYYLFVEELKLVAKDRESDEGNVEENLRQFAYQFVKEKAVS